MTPRRLPAILAACVLAGAPGCRFSYELSENDSAAQVGDGDGDAGLGGALTGDGDGDGDTGAGSGAGGTPDGGGGMSETGGTNGGGGMNETGGTDQGTGGVDPGTGGAGTGGAGTGGAGTGGAGTGGAGTGGAGTGGAAGLGDYHVTSTAGDASAGTFRNAVDQALASGTAKTITFEPGLTILMNSVLPNVTTSLTIIGETTHLDFSGISGSPDCFTSGGGTLVLDGLEISGCPDNPINFDSGAGNRLTNCFIHDNGGSVISGQSATGSIIGPGNRITGTTVQGVFMNSANSLVVDNFIYDVGGNGIFMASSSDGSKVLGNRIVRSNTGIQLGSNALGILIRFNTIVDISGNGITVGQATEIEIQNNIISGVTIFGISAAQANVPVLSHNLYYQNGGTGVAHCSGCTPGAGSVVNQDPLYINAGLDNFELQDGSPAINAGLNIGEDRNGPGAGDFFGSAPDMGFFESNY